MQNEYLCAINMETTSHGNYDNSNFAKRAEHDRQEIDNTVPFYCIQWRHITIVPLSRGISE